jgi:hypothetical protein
MSCKSEHAGVARLMDLLAQTELAPTIIETAVESGLAQVSPSDSAAFVLSSSDLIQHSLPLHGVVQLLTAVPCVVCAVTCDVRQQRALTQCNAVRQYILNEETSSNTYYAEYSCSGRGAMLCFR